MQPVKLKRGHVREDGMVFLSYSRYRRKSGGLVEKELWLPREQFDSVRAKLIRQALASQKRLKATDPEGQARKLRAYWNKNRTRLNEQSRKWQQTNRKKCLKWIADWRRRAVKKDPAIRLIHNARTRICMALVKNSKSTNTLALLGMPSQEAYKQYIEARFTERMTWANYGKWEVDHIIPCRLFRPWDLIAQRTCFHHTNLQPLWKRDNIRKRHRVSAADFDRVCEHAPVEHVSYLRGLQQTLDAAGKLEKSQIVTPASPAEVPSTTS